MDLDSELLRLAERIPTTECGPQVLGRTLVRAQTQRLLLTSAASAASVSSLDSTAEHLCCRWSLQYTARVILAWSCLKIGGNSVQVIC